MVGKADGFGGCIYTHKGKVSVLGTRKPNPLQRAVFFAHCDGRHQLNWLFTFLGGHNNGCHSHIPGVFAAHHG